MKPPKDLKLFEVRIHGRLKRIMATEIEDVLAFLRDHGLGHEEIKQVEPDLTIYEMRGPGQFTFKFSKGQTTGLWEQP